MGLLSTSMDSLSLKPRRSSNASNDGEIVDGNENDTSTLDKDEGNVLMALIQQCGFYFRFMSYLSMQ